jgi:hypothetical protein
VIGADGERSCAEVEIVRRLRTAGWSAFWFDSFGKAPSTWRRYTTTIAALPTELATTLSAIETSAGLQRGGRWDVIAWRDGDVRFIELKGEGDSIRPNQRAWVASALRHGFQPSQFAVVDYRVASSALHGPGDEARVVAAFEGWLVEQGWRLVADHGTWADVVAERDGRRLVGEAKGYTSSPGLDVDTMFGQLLRRMDGRGDTDWAVIVPTRSVPAVLRVPPTVRERLGIRVFEVTDDDAVREVSE